MSYHRDYHQFDFDDHHLDMMYPPTDLDLEIERTHGKCLPKCNKTMTEFKIYLQQLVEDKKLPRRRAIEIWEFFNEECEETSESHAWDLAQQEINFALKEND